MALTITNISSSLMFQPSIVTGHSILNNIRSGASNSNVNFTNLSSNITSNITTFGLKFTNNSREEPGESSPYFSFSNDTHKVTSFNRTVKSNYTRNLEKSLSRITNGFAKTFSHSFAMNDRKTVNHHPNDVPNSPQRFMGMEEGGKFQQFHSIPFPSGFPAASRGPIATKNGRQNNEHVTVRPKLSISNGNSSRLHLPVLWTALSLALGVEVRGELIRGLPCITRFNQLFCRSGGTSYPSDKIERFIDDNRALMRRMHGEFISLSAFTDNLNSGRRRRSPEEVLEIFSTAPLVNADNSTAQEAPPISRSKRQASRSRSPGPLPKSDRIDACLSEEEVATPYWASNSRGKILAIVNTKEFSQIIHQEICTKTSTKRCSGDCGCEQKYKYHRLMAYDPDNDCKGVFMDWFLFPSCCSCRCDPL